MSVRQLQESIQKSNIIKARGRSMYRGVDKHAGKWRARINFSGQRKCLGYYSTDEEAARAFDRAAIAGSGRCADDF